MSDLYLGSWLSLSFEARWLLGNYLDVRRAMMHSFKWFFRSGIGMSPRDCAKYCHFVITPLDYHCQTPGYIGPNNREAVEVFNELRQAGLVSRLWEWDGVKLDPSRDNFFVRLSHLAPKVWAAGTLP